MLNRLYVYTCTCIYWAVNLVPVIKINETTPIKHFDLTKLFLNTVFLNVHKTLLFQIQPWFISPDKKENLKNWKGTSCLLIFKTLKKTRTFLIHMYEVDLQDLKLKGPVPFTLKKIILNPWKRRERYTLYCRGQFVTCLFKPHVDNTL